MTSTTFTSTRRLVLVPSGGVELEGAFDSPGRPRAVVLVAHGRGSSHASASNQFVAMELRRAGFATLLLDLLTEREDLEGAQRFDITLLAHRLGDAVRWIKRQAGAAGLPVGLLGASTGSAAALEVAATLGKGITAVVSQGGRPDLAARRPLARVMAPTLFIVGALDSETIELNEVYERLDCVKSVSIVPGATHAFQEPGAMEAATELACDWFRRHLGKPVGDRSAQPRTSATQS